MDGVSLLFATDPDEKINFADLAELQSSDHTLGSKTMLYIRVRFSDEEEGSEPIDLETLKERQALCEKFWFENSNGKSTLTTTFTDTVTLPESAKSHLRQDAPPLVKAAGEAKGVDWDEANYDFFTVLTSSGLWEYAGAADVGGRSSHLNGANSSNVKTASHEFGHNLGLHHANYWRTDSTSPIGRDSIPGGYVGDGEGWEWIEYGHKFSVMGGIRSDGDMNQGRGHFTPGEKVKLDWLGAGELVRVYRTTATPIRLYRHDVETEFLDSKITRVARAIKIYVDSGDYAQRFKRRYWLSYRKLPTDGISGDWLPYGLQVDWQRETYGYDGSILLDMTPYSRDDPTLAFTTQNNQIINVDNEDKEDAVLIIGRTYSDEVADIHFTPIARGGENPNEWIDVLINIGTQDRNIDPQITSFTASSTAVAPGEMVDFSVEAEDEDGDTLYYTWTFGDNSMVENSLNSTTASKSWNNDNIFTVRVTVSDGKGGSDSKEIHVEVGYVSDLLAIMGRVTSGNFPVKEALVRIYSGQGAWTDGDGNYALHTESPSENLLWVEKEGYSFRPLFSNPVYLTNLDVTGRDWVGIPEDPERAPVVHLTTPNSPIAFVPEGSGLFLKAELSENNFPNSFGQPSVSWSVLETPEGGAVTFSPPHGPATVATFSLPGFYKILISGTNDGVNTGSMEVSVNAGLTPGGKPSSEDEIVYYKMDEGEGFTTTNSRGEDNNGRLVNGASWTESGGGISGTGIVLDGISGKIYIENTEGPNFRSYRPGRTIALWFKAEDPLRETKQVLHEQGGWARGLNIYLEAGRLYVGGWNSGANGWDETFLSTELVDTNWHHVALVMYENWINDFEGDTFKGFLDGREFGSGDSATLIVHEYNITLGANRDTTRYHDGVATRAGDHFAGIVDEFHLWNRGLNPDELGQLFNLEGYIGPELTLSSVDHSEGSVVVPPGTGIVLEGSAKGNGSLDTKWETVLAPKGGRAIFGNSTSPSTVAAFSTPGYYKLRFSADDSIQKSAIDVDVHAGLDAGSNFYSPQEAVYLSLDEGSGSRVVNSAGDYSVGNVEGEASWTSQGGGISGTALEFFIDDAEIINFFDYQPPNMVWLEKGGLLFESEAAKKSLALWIKPNETGAAYQYDPWFSSPNKEVIFKMGGRDSGFIIYLDGNLLYIANWNYGRFSWRTFLTVPITRGKWQHLALVLDADYSGYHPHGLKAYLNGRQVASGLASGMDTINSDIILGSRGDDRDWDPFHDYFTNEFLSFNFSGIVDEFHAYQDHALTIDEIGMLYAFGNVGPTVDAGPDQLAVPPYSIILLEGSSTDDGRWSSPVTYSWHIIDGPGTGRFRPLEDNGASAQIDFFEGGSYRIALGAYDGQVTTFDELMVTVRQPTDFQRFMHGFSAIAVDERGYHADPDGDERTNLAEYALGGAPDVAETYYQLGLQHELVREGGDWYAEFRYPRRRDAAQRGLRYEFQVSHDLSTDSWMDRGYTVLNITPIDEVFLEYRLRIDEPVGSVNSRLFGRVRVVIAE